MNRDGVKTIIGLLVIGLIIVATFLYGNQQRQAQLQRDQDLKRQQQVVTKPVGKDQTKPGTSIKPQPGVPAPSSNPIQGQGITPAKTDVSGGSNGPSQAPPTTPKTGSETSALLGLIALTTAGVFYTRGRRNLAFALVSTKLK